jgi:hypothetical protein
MRPIVPLPLRPTKRETPRPSWPERFGKRCDSRGLTVQGAWACEDDRGWPTRRQGSAETRLVTVGCKREVEPEFSSSHRPVLQLTTCGNRSGRLTTGRTSDPNHGGATALAGTSLRAIDSPPNDVRDSPSCTGVGVEKLGRGGSTFGVSRPRPVSIRASPPGSGVVPFSSSSRWHQIRVPIDCSGRSKTFARVSLTTTLVPTSPEPWEADDQSNHAYGISCLTRPISSVRVKARTSRNRYRMGRLSDTPNNSGAFTSRTTG